MDQNEDYFDFNLGEENDVTPFPEVASVSEAVVPDRRRARAPTPSTEELVDEGSVTPRQGKVYCAKKWFFTFNMDSLPPERCEEIMNNLEDSLKPLCNQYMCQLERGANGNLHIQGCINLKKKTRPFCPIRKRCIFPDLAGAHWEGVKNWLKAVEYCSKADTFAGRRWHFNVEGIWYMIYGTLLRTYIETL